MVTGLVRDGTCGVRDFSQLLSRELHKHGITARAKPQVAGTANLRSCFAAGYHHLRQAGSLPRTSTVVWNYSAFAYGCRGIPLHAVLFGVVLRLRGLDVITVMHEAAAPWGPGLKRCLVAALQRLVLPLVFLGSTVVVVTTSRRAAWLQPVAKVLQRPMEVIPVFSNIPVIEHVGPRRESRDPGSSGGVVVLCHRWAEACGDVLLEAVEVLNRHAPVPVVLLGAPDVSSPSGLAWRAAARAHGVESSLQQTGPVTAEEYSRHLQACAVVVLVNADGPTGRRSTLAAAMAHGCAVVALDGPDRWQLLAERRAVHVVPPDGAALATAIQGLLNRPEDRQVLGERARAFYEAHMSVESAGKSFARLVGTTGSRSSVAMDSPTGSG